MSTILHAIELDPEILLLRAGAKTIIKKECVPLAEVDALLERAREWGFEALAARDIEYGLGTRDSIEYRQGGGFVTVFLAREGGALPRARALLEGEIDTGAPLEAQRAAMRGFGELLGYPRCCVEAYLGGPSGPFFERGTTGFYLDAYHRTGGAFDPLLNRFALERALISHAPCSYACQPSVTMARAAMAALREADAGHAERCLERLSRPVLWWAQERQVILGGARWEGGWLHYDDVEVSLGGDPAALSVRRAFERMAEVVGRGRRCAMGSAPGSWCAGETGAWSRWGTSRPWIRPFSSTSAGAGGHTMRRPGRGSASEARWTSRRGPGSRRRRGISCVSGWPPRWCSRATRARRAKATGSS